MDQISSSNEEMPLDELVGLLAAHVKILSFTVDGLVRIMMSKKQLSERELEAINADALSKAFGWSGEGDDDEMAGAGGDIS